MLISEAGSKTAKQNFKPENLNKATTVQQYIESFCVRNDDIAEAAVMLSESQADTLMKCAQWPESRELNLAMTNTANAAIKRAGTVKIIPAVSTNDNHQACVIATPLIKNKVTLGAIVIAVKTSNNIETTEHANQLEQAAATLCSMVLSSPTASRPSDANKLLQLQTAFLREVNLINATNAFVNELTSLLKFSRVSIGELKNQQIQILAISNHVDFKFHQPLVKSISDAMEEAADQTESVLYPPLEDDKPKLHLAHKILYKKTGKTTCSIPLIHEDNIIGVISIEHQNNTMLSRESVIWYESIARYFAPLLALKQKAEEPWHKRAYSSLKNRFIQFISQDSITPKLLVATGFIACLIFTFIPVTYHIGAKANIEGATQRIIAAPVDGFIHEVHARPGDAVKKGDLLIKLADKDLILEKEKWESEIVQQENNFSGALARQDRTSYAISQAKAAQARAELALIEQALDRLHVLSPIDGVVLEGDLTQSLGAPIALGDSLMTIAPKNEYRLIINVDERDIKEIALGQTGALALSAMPTEKMHFTVSRITPMAKVKNGSNSYEVEAKILGESTFLRPGMQGIAKIKAGNRSGLWNISHRIVNWTRMTLWKWGI